VCILVYATCAQNDVEQYADTDSEEVIEILQDPSHSDEKCSRSEWCHRLPSDKADAHQSVEE
jgi:hypothetical protein